MKLEPREIVNICTSHYRNWKEEAFRAENKDEIKKYLEKAFFWLELQNNLLILWTVENTKGSDPKVQEKVEKAQVNMNKKIIEYAKKVLQELE